MLDRRVDGALHVLFLAHVAHHRDALAARGFDVGDVPGNLGCGSAVLATSATLAPSRAARRAMASPIPRLAPEMNMVLEARGMSGS